MPLGDCPPASSGLTWQSLAVLKRSWTRDWNENKAEWLLSDMWYMTCNGMFPELPLHMAAYNPPDLAQVHRKIIWSLCVLTWLQSREGGGWHVRAKLDKKTCTYMIYIWAKATAELPPATRVMVYAQYWSTWWHTVCFCDGIWNLLQLEANPFGTTVTDSKWYIQWRI